MSTNCTELNCNENLIVWKLLENLSENRYVLGAFYLALMGHIFLGIALIADVFVRSIETITNQTKRVDRYNPATKQVEVVQERVWNRTVANLSLMALGSSSPEILLATIEIIGNG